MELLPAFSQRYHLNPDEYWGLTRGEFDAYLKHSRDNGDTDG